MMRHTDQLYRLAELPAFIEEALSNVSLKRVIDCYLAGDVSGCYITIKDCAYKYAEQWVDDWMTRNQPNLWADKEDEMDPEVRAIEAGVMLFSHPDCKAGLPE